MKYRIASVIVEMNPNYPTLLNQSKAYQVSDDEKEDFSIGVSSNSLERFQKTYPGLTMDNCEYIAYGSVFNRKIVDYNGFFLHSSAVCYNNKAYLFSAPSGTGKSTHTSLWLEAFPGSYILNDDKPIIRIEKDKIIACGTPFSGKTDLNQNKEVELQGICFIERSQTNWIKKLSVPEAIYEILNQTIRPKTPMYMDKVLQIIDKIIINVNVYKMGCNTSLDAAKIAYEAMNV